jgi:hypothetical protein
MSIFDAITSSSQAVTGASAIKGAFQEAPGAIQAIGSATGALIVVDTALGSFTVDPANMVSQPGDADAGSSGTTTLVAQWLLKVLNIRVSLRLAGQSFGPVSVTP